MNELKLHIQTDADRYSHGYYLDQLDNPFNQYEYYLVKRQIERFSRSLHPNSCILDLGGGTGAYATWLRSLGHYPIVTDLSFFMVQYAKLKHLSSVMADAEGLPYNDDTFDACLSVAMLEHVPSPKPIIQEIVRVVKPGGKILLIVPNRLYWCHSTFPIIRRLGKIVLGVGSKPRDVYEEFRTGTELIQALTASGAHWKPHRTIHFILTLPRHIWRKLPVPILNAYFHIWNMFEHPLSQWSDRGYLNIIEAYIPG